MELTGGEREREGHKGTGEGKEGGGGQQALPAAFVMMNRFLDRLPLTRSVEGGGAADAAVAPAKGGKAEVAVAMRALTELVKESEANRVYLRTSGALGRLCGWLAGETGEGGEGGATTTTASECHCPQLVVSLLAAAAEKRRAVDTILSSGAFALSLKLMVASGGHLGAMKRVDEEKSQSKKDAVKEEDTENTENAADAVDAAGRGASGPSNASPIDILIACLNLCEAMVESPSGRNFLCRPAHAPAVAAVVASLSDVANPTAVSAAANIIRELGLHDNGLQVRGNMAYAWHAWDAWHA